MSSTEETPRDTDGVEKAEEVSGFGEPDFLERLWTPYRMAYINKRLEPTPEGMTGEPFLDIPRMSDEEGLIIARGKYVFACLNLYPYNSGHSMVIPYRRVAELENLTLDESTELMAFTQKLIRVIKKVSSPAAFNVGMNLGRGAGGSLAYHLHQHVVPRWIGDANFITILDDAKIFPRLLQETRKLFADAWEEMD